VLEAVKRERRVAWMILSNASVHSLEDGILTVRFNREGDLKGFTTSKIDAVLKNVLSSGFGLNVMVNGIAGAVDDGPPARGAGPVAAPPVRRVSTPQFDGPPPPQESFDPGDEPDDEEPPASPAGPPELTGMDLIQRELGGQIISETDS
jgi:DNA polymerase-3 subunit gamma/tau